MPNEPIILKLTPEDALRLTRILLDEDKEDALSFLNSASNLRSIRLQEAI